MLDQVQERNDVQRSAPESDQINDSDHVAYPLYQNGPQEYNENHSRNYSQRKDRSAHTLSTNIKPIWYVRNQAGIAKRTDDSCSSLYDQVANPSIRPLPFCGLKDNPTPTIRCYQSSIYISPIQHSDETTMKSNNKISAMDVICSFQNIAVHNRNITQPLRDCVHSCDIQSYKMFLLLLHGKQSQCPMPTVRNKTDEHDYTMYFVQDLVNLNAKKQLNPSLCGQWINKTILFFIANEPYNIYFLFLMYYNVFVTINRLSSNEIKDLTSFRSNTPKFVIVRLADATTDINYRFGDFEQVLFPELKVLSHLNNLVNDSRGKVNNITCFQRVIKVPLVYSAFPFRCLVNDKLRNEIFRCFNTTFQNPTRIHTQTKLISQIRGLHANNSTKRGQAQSNETRQQRINYRELRLAVDHGSQTGIVVVPNMLKYRLFVLTACGIIDQQEIRDGDNLKSSSPNDKVVIRQQYPLQVVVIKRTPYLRHGMDHLYSFQRLLANEAELILALEQNISTRGLVNVTSIYMEELDICDQIKLAHSADILIGVHGAGLIHSWWMRDSGVLLELIPRSKLNRPTFKVLSGLIGRKYYSIVLEKSPLKHHNEVNISAVLEFLNGIYGDHSSK